METTLLGNEITEIFEAFIETSKNNSLSTATCYDSRIREFFKIVLGKSLEDVTKKDVRNIKAVNINTYANILIAKGNSKGTVITKLRSVKSFFTELSINSVIDYNLDIFKARFKSDEKHYDSLQSMEEVQSMYEFVKSRKNYAIEQYLYIKSLFVTANRKTSMLNLTWSDIVKKYDYLAEKSVYVIVVKDKGNKIIEKPIADEFYEELLQLHEGQEKVFDNITNDMIRYTMEQFTKQLNDGRNINIHSIKASALTIAYRLTKDIMKVKQLGSHADISTTQIYIRDDESYTNQLSYKLNNKIDTEKIKKLSHEELLEIIMGNEELKYSVALKIN